MFPAGGTCTAPWRTMAAAEAGITSARNVSARAASSIMSALCSACSRFTCMQRSRCDYLHVRSTCSVGVLVHQVRQCTKWKCMHAKTLTFQAISPSSQ